MMRFPAVLAAAAALALLAAGLVWWTWQPVPQVQEVASTVTEMPMPPFQRTAPDSVSPAEAGKIPAPITDPASPKPSRMLPRVDRFDVPGAIPGEALLTFRSAQALADFRARAARLGLTILGFDPKLRTARVRVTDPSALAADFAEHSDDYEQAGPNYFARIPGLPLAETPGEASTDPANAGGRTPFQSQGLDFIGATGDRSRWGKGVTVAVVDSGVGPHPSLENVEISHVDLLQDGSEMNGHGTAMATLIAGNDSHVGGVAPAARLLDIRVADAEGVSNTALLATGIVRAVDLGARVINISLGTAGYSPVLAEAVQYAQSRNAVIVAAAGNEQQTALALPAGLPGVLSVGSVDASGRQAWFSNSGTGLTLVAPGVGIVSGYTDSRMVIGSGTSQSAALTSGAVAYLASRGYSSSKIIPLLIRTARPLDAPSTAVGAGLLQLPK